MNMNPGMLAYIVGLRMDPQFNGRVVELIRFDPDARLVHTRSGAWYDGAAWVVDARHLGFETLLLPPKHLRPITDPDIDTTETTDALHDSLVAVLAEARPV